MKEQLKKKFEYKKPLWLKTPIARGETFFKIKKSLRTRKLVTVCEEAKCPNISQCWNTGTATFMILVIPAHGLVVFVILKQATLMVG